MSRDTNSHPAWGFICFMVAVFFLMAINALAIVAREPVRPAPVAVAP